MPKGSGTYGLKAADTVDLSKLKLRDLAHRITRHLGRLEEDDAWNRVEGASLDSDPRRKLCRASARRGQRAAITIVNISYQGGQSYPKADAIAYLEWLEAGNKGTIRDFLAPR